MSDLIFIVSIALLSYLCGRFHNYSRWVTSGKIYAAARKTYKLNQELWFENRILKQELRERREKDVSN